MISSIEMRETNILLLSEDLSYPSEVGGKQPDEYLMCGWSERGLVKNAFFPSPKSDIFSGMVFEGQIPLSADDVDSENIRNGIIEHQGPNLYDWQVDAVSKILHAQDLVVSAGTGSGKSIIYQAIAMLLQVGFVLVISPLKGLMFDQVSSNSFYTNPDQAAVG